jgi:putative acetyltransferase
VGLVCCESQSESPVPPAPITIRRFEPNDAARVCEIFFRSIHEVAISKYSQTQVDAWAPNVPDPAKWLKDLSEFETFLALNERAEALAWIAMTQTGYIDMLFCLPEAIGRGFAAALYDTVEKIAVDRGITRMTAHASLLAQPFFARRGWKVEKHEMHVRNGTSLPRAEMSKTI